MNFALIISRLFDPLIILTGLFFLTAVRSGVAGWDVVSLMGILFSTMILPPALLLLWAVKTGRVTNWDISNRRQRVRALMVFGLFLVFDYFILQLFGTPLIRQVFSVFCAFFAGFFIVTLRWKISGHMATATLIFCLLIRWYSLLVLPFVLILPFLGWSRLKLKRHTIGEVVGGVVYPIMVFFLARELHLI